MASPWPEMSGWTNSSVELLLGKHGDICEHASYHHRIDGDALPHAWRTPECSHSFRNASVYFSDRRCWLASVIDSLLPGAADPDRYNYCPIPESGEDAVLFASLGLLLAALLSGRLSALWVFIAGTAFFRCDGQCDCYAVCRQVRLWCMVDASASRMRRQSGHAMVLTGGALQLLNTACNMGPLSNAIVLWLGIRPADVFLYVFLPPLLLDSAVRMDYFVFRKVRRLQQLVTFVRRDYNARVCAAINSPASRRMLAG